MTAPTLVIVGGPNGSGKTTIITEPLRDRMPVINADELARELGRDDMRAAAAVAREIASGQVAQLLHQKQQFAYETTLSTDDLRVAEKARSNGYRVEAYLVWTGSIELSVERVAHRVATGGHNVPMDEIGMRYRKAMEVLPQVLGAVNYAEVRDNSAPGDRAPRMVLAADNGLVAKLGKELPDWLVTAFEYWQAPLEVGSDLTSLAADPRLYRAERIVARKRAGSV